MWKGEGEDEAREHSEQMKRRTEQKKNRKEEKEGHAKGRKGRRRKEEYQNRSGTCSAKIRKAKQMTGPCHMSLGEKVVEDKTNQDGKKARARKSHPGFSE